MMPLLVLPALCSAVELSPVPSMQRRSLCLPASVWLWLAKPYCIPAQPASSSPCAICTRPAAPEEGQGKELQEVEGPRAEAVTDLEHHLWQLCVCSLWRGARQSKQPARCRASGKRNLLVTSLGLFSPSQASVFHILCAQ